MIQNILKIFFNCNSSVYFESIVARKEPLINIPLSNGRNIFSKLFTCVTTEKNDKFCFKKSIK